MVPAPVLMTPDATGGGLAGNGALGASEIVRLADVGSPALSHNEPQLVAIGQPIYRFTGALKTAGDPGPIVTTVLAPLARTIVFRQAVSETTHVEIPLPPQAHVEDLSDAATKHTAMSSNATRQLCFFMSNSSPRPVEWNSFTADGKR